MNWRTIGDCSLGDWVKSLPLNSQIVLRGEQEATYLAAKPHSRLCRGMLQAESSGATHFNAVPPSKNNPLNLRVRGQAEFQSFPNIAACVNEWRSRITSSSYAYKDTTTVRDLINIYAPSFENDVNQYVATVEAVITRLPIVVKGTAMSIPVPAPPLEIAITPHGANRPALEMASPSWITVHEVGNQSPGADENMHRNFVHNGGGSAQVSFHFVVGPTKAIQLIPLDEAAWHASDGYNGTGNRDSIAIETIQIGNFDKTLWHLAWLINEIATNPNRFYRNKNRTWDLSIEKIKQHHDWAPDGKNCPEFIRNRGLWPELMRRVDLWNAVGKEIELPEEKPQPEPEKHTIPEGHTRESLRRLYGRFIDPTTGNEERFDLRTAPSQRWLAYGKQTGLWPKAQEKIRRGNGNELYRWDGGFSWERKRDA